MNQHVRNSSLQSAAVIVALLSLLAWAPLLFPGFIQTHSGLGAIYDALSWRSPLTGWLPAHGTPGDGPLATWLLVILKTVIGPLAALKLLYIMGFMLSGIGVFALIRRILGDRTAVVAAAVYMFAPYHLSVVYVRGTLAEALALAWAPFLFLALHSSIAAPSRRATAWVTGAATTLLLLNFGLGVVFTLLGLSWSVAAAPLTLTGRADVLDDTPNGIETTARPNIADSTKVSSRQVARRTFLSSSAGVVGVVMGLAAGLLVLLPAGSPFLPHMPGWEDHFVYVFQLFLPVWGFGTSVPGWQDGMPFQLGLAPVAMAIIALWAVGETNDHAYRRNVLGSLVLACIVIVLTLNIAAPLWRIVPLSRLLAYPWQLLAPASLFLALVAGSAAAWLMGEFRDTHGDAAPARSMGSLTTLAVLLAAIVLASYPYLSPRFIATSDLPDMSHLPVARLGNDILLLDARFDSGSPDTQRTDGVVEVQPGRNLHLTLIWQALGQPQGDYTIFAHLFDAAGVKRGQQDMRPHDGRKPTNTWLPGEVVRDDITIPVAADAPAGDYTVRVGMYVLTTMERLPVAGSEAGEVVIGPIRVR